MSFAPAKPRLHRDPWSDPRIVVPTAEAWSAMTRSERDAAERCILDALDEYRVFMAEGTRHSRPKIGAYNNLGDHFARAGRQVFLATELAVLYPGKAAIVPDLLAVMDVSDPEHERESWRVPDEGRGIDLVIEFRNLGKKHKDLVTNVRDYARLGIAEYFSFDCRTKVLRAWHLPSAKSRRYTQRMPQGGVYVSQVLDLELGVSKGKLRFFKDMALIPTSKELLGRVQNMADDLQSRLEAVERARLEEQQAREQAERARLEEQQAREQAERARLEEQQAREQAEQKLEQAERRLAELAAELERARGR